jgi:2,4-dienoyl-CoA reductase-like NADH-dependent reductase (Old Yellow Enzyme family)
MTDPLSFRHGPTMRNRLALAPLTNQQSHADGTLSDAERHYLTMRATGGFGLTMTCAASVQAGGRGFAGQLGVHDDAHLPGLTRLAADLNAAGTMSWVQLHHAGIRSPQDLIGTQPVGPSDDASTGARALTSDEIEQLIADFVAAAVRAETAGFHGVELHGAHGYLICQFLSADLNTRTDQYGGSLENRSRLLTEIVRRVRDAVGDDMAIGVRLSAERFGLVVDEVREVFSHLVDTGSVDMIDMSIWDVDKNAADDPYTERRLLDLFTELPRGEVRLAAAGKIHTPADVQRVLDAGVDIAMLGRVAILHHDYPQRATDPEWVPSRPPVSAEALAAEGVSPPFIEYLATSFGFVER